MTCYKCITTNNTVVKEVRALFLIDPRSSVPLYEQLEQNIVSLISAGALAPDDQLPSVRSLARELGINPNTVQKAYGHLEERGIIYQAAGRGSFVSPVGQALEKIAREKRAALQDVLREARRAGVSRDEALALVQSVYGEDRT